ncbi:MAG: hypothetical protein UH850_01860 [Paludibacteraceae bacterium]|nr:hypothetical protein [Paludibacteraceae bacterium]
MDKKYFLIYISALSLLMLTMLGCSNKKNTAISRGYQAMTTRYNVYYNGRESLEKGKENIENAYKPDYSQILKMYPVGDKSTSGAAFSQCNRALDKCQTAIKLHSMRKKPVKKPGKMKDPDYAAFYAQEEFNPKMDDVWMLMGETKYYNEDFLGAAATFTYVEKHFSVHKDLVVKALIWRARALMEMDWLYEADEILSNISDDDLTFENQDFYAAAMANLRLKQNEKAEAMKYLKQAIPSAENKKEKTRFYFIMAQLNQDLGYNDVAYAYYDSVIRKCPDYEMQFNARIRQSEVVSGDLGKSDRIVAKLKKEAKSSKNKDYLDQIYYAIGNIYLTKGDTANAIKNYIVSAESSTRNGIEKAVTLMKLGQLYYQKRNYIDAEPCYAEASSILSNDHPDYNDVFNKAKNLTELKQNYEVVHLQDSLLALSEASDAERIAAAQREVDKVKARLQKEQEKREQDSLNARIAGMEIETVVSKNVNTIRGSNWYFYNAQAVSKGKINFKNKWGDRRLEDNWNRKNKQLMMISEEVAINDTANNSQNVPEFEDRGSDSERFANGQSLPELTLGYYLNQIPKTPEAKALALNQVRTSLFNEAVVFDEKIRDYDMAIQTYDEWMRRFGGENADKAADVLFNSYRVAEKMNDNALAVKYKDELVSKYPNSKYSQVLSDPDYANKLVRMANVEDSIYRATYNAYHASEYKTVLANTDYMQKNYKMSSLMPKFMLLKSLSFGKLGQHDSLKASLGTLVSEYPKSDVATMAKDILALIEQGNVSSKGTTASLASQREQILLEENIQTGVVDTVGFRYSDKSAYHFYIISQADKVDQNRLLFEVATYNFSKFLVKDYDLKIRPGLVSVSGLDNLDEALWYQKGVKESDGIMNLLKGTDYTLLVISEENSRLIGRGYTLDQYKEFYEKNILNRKQDNKKKINIELIGNDAPAAPLEIKEGDDLNNMSQSKIAPAAKQDNKTEAKQDPKSVNTDEKTTDEKTTEAVKSDEAKPEANKVEEKKVDAAPKKELKKYKNLYTLDRTAEHYFALLITRGAVDSEKLMQVLVNANEEWPGGELKVEKTDGKNFTLIVTVGLFENSSVAMDYLKGIVKSDALKQRLQNVSYNSVIISKDNLDALRQSGNLNVYMELFKKGYLGR